MRKDTGIHTSKIILAPCSIKNSCFKLHQLLLLLDNFYGGV